MPVLHPLPRDVPTFVSPAPGLEKKRTEEEGWKRVGWGGMGQSSPVVLNCPSPSPVALPGVGVEQWGQVHGHLPAAADETAISVGPMDGLAMQGSAKGSPWQRGPMPLLACVVPLVVKR